MRGATRACHPERSEAKPKDPEKLTADFATGFLDFARNDSIKIERLALFSYRISRCQLCGCPL